MPENTDVGKCEECIFHASGQCCKWDCEYIGVKEAEEAFRKIKAEEVLQENE